MPLPDSPGFNARVAEVVADLARALGGRTLVLFTSQSSLQDVHSALRPVLEEEDISVLGQGLDGSRRSLLEVFRQQPRTVLLGTQSFWEGIDLPGPGLSCVVIARLPFSVPSDPLAQARSRGREDPFGEIALPRAILRLKQGFGRLIRRADDRGAAVLCDGRLNQRSYGQTVLGALPPARRWLGPSAALAGAVASWVGPLDSGPAEETLPEEGEGLAPAAGQPGEG
jgi:DNA polymerase-3 subunit epsilon/ATP-dependent DNA helicase DinG